MMLKKILAIVLLVRFVSSAQTVETLPLIPKPAVVHPNGGFFRLSPKTAIVVQTKELKSEASIFNEYLQKNYGFRLNVSVGDVAFSKGIVLSQVKVRGKGNEAYTMSVTKQRIKINGERPGIFYGLQTLIQLMPIEKKRPVEIPCLEIIDFPRYAWRGMHLDVCRHFFSKEFIKRYIDYIAMYKMNTFHWHLTEDQGWRIEIKKYPKLTEVGAWRNGSMIGAFNEQRFDSIRYGGYYTHADIREIVAYALKRHVTIVPEIEMPGHSMAALASYQELSCTGRPFEVAKGWGVFEDVYCPKEETFTFLENVLTEVCELFPGKYIHIGGDECPKGRWKSCSHCQALIKQEGLKDELELQSYFIRRIEKFLNSKDKQIIGWDEILGGGLAPNAAVMSWRGMEGGIAAAQQHHHAVMSPGSHCYFDYYQGSPQNEPLAIGGYTTLEKVYSYEPIPAGLSPEEEKYILGAQGNVWTEYITTPQHVEYMAIPRMAALAEVVWSPKEQRDYLRFRQRLMKHFQLLDTMGVNYAKTVYEIQSMVKPSPTGKGIVFELSTPLDANGIRYTLDGSQPMATSAHFQSPISIFGSMIVNVGYFANEQQKGNITSQQFTISKSTGKKISLKTLPNETYYGDGPFTLVNGIRGDFLHHGQHWLGFWGPDLDAVIDLGEREPISKVTLDVFNEEGSWIYRPKSVEVFVGNDTTEFVSVKKLSSEEIAQSGNVLTVNFSPRSVQYIKVIARNAGKIPDGKPGAGHDAWLFVDELMVE